MAKSGRAKSKIRNANVRRANIYGPVEFERVVRLAEKQNVKSGTLDQIMEVEGAEKPSDAMETDEAPKKKISLRKGPNKKRKGAKGVTKGKRFKWVPQKR
ncbi:hypothetical protein AYI68_g3799 [Smittium mucronatum]|uniref:DUF2423 domain-containing protein n=1 Tax=Smittium mucronatum TaxID=133383 RepID=A0A1R0GZ18_9FUNG|nr:hypothetical protein AYI68_g3799 [Smittium mucronatum]